MSRAYIIAAKRTAIGRVGGLHRHRAIEELCAPLFHAVIDEIGMAHEEIEEVILGNAAGGGGNPARLALLAAGLSASVPGITVDRQCASGLDAILIAARQIESGAVGIVMAGGAESPSTAPWRVKKPRSLYHGMPAFFLQAQFTPDAAADPSMLEAAEAVARDFGITRAEQDEYALRSHRLAAQAAANGEFDGEIVPLGDGPAETRDECVRANLSEALLRRMPPLLGEGGSVTAGNSCQINDGAAIVLIVSEQVWLARGSPPALRILGGASAGVAPLHLGTGPVPAVEKLLRLLPQFSLDDIAAVEFNEAFAAQVLASLKRLTISLQKVNTGGGALAFGHPYGASGAVLVARLFTRLIRHKDKQSQGLGLALLGAAGGLGVAALFEPVFTAKSA